MKFAEINAIFSEVVAKYLNEGYVLNPYTMGGHQGEIAKVDLKNDHEVIRVRLEKVHADCVRFRSGTALIVGRTTDERYVKPCELRWSDTMWSNELEVVEQRNFWQMTKEYREIDWYLEGDEGLEALKKTDERAERKYRGTGAKKKVYDESMNRIGLKLLRKIPGHKNKRLADVTSFYKVGKFGEKATYYVCVKGHEVKVA